ncbi:retrovirus-related pol polyprotein from transposon TNT 1-94 [Tanacetum coccineum]|uniref:Retrovirus-related pol polyprotein from transposon TNT 1-94 n=1 Tax=Tanacetum coccineum TaxID=301880 RepID=A0ABQ5EL37_9ASTR
MYPSPHHSQPQISHSSVPPSQQYQSHQTSSVPPTTYNTPQSLTQQLTKFPQMGLAVPVFNQVDDLISCLNKAMAFLTDAVSSRWQGYVQQVQGRQGQSYAGNSYKGNATSLGGNNARGQAKVVKWYNCQGEGHMARQCTQPKRPRNAAWFKEKAMLAEAQEAGQILDEEQLAFLADPGIPDIKAAQTTIPNTAAFQTEDLDAYDSDCDDVSNVKAILMANLSNYGSDVISEKAQRIKPTLYNGGVISSQHVASPVIDDEETLILEEMEAVQQYFVDKQCFEIHKKELFLENDGLLQKIMSQDVLICVMNSTAVFDDVHFEMQKHFEHNDLKAQLQAKDTTICKLKEHIKSMRETEKEEKVKHEMDEIETINIELEHSVAKLLYENERLHKEIEHLKKIYKDQFDSIKKTRALSKEHDDSLIAQLNSKSMENVDLKRQIQDKVFVITSLKNYLQKLNGKETVENATQIPIATTIALGKFKIDLEPLAPTEKLIAVTLMNKVKKVKFSEPLTSSSNIQQVESSKTPDSNTPVLSSTGLKCSTSTCRSQPTGNKKNDRILQTPSSNIKNKVEVQRRRVKSKSNKKNRVKDPICDANVKHTMLNANSELICVKCNQCMFDANHDVCFLDFVNDVNVRSKSKSAKKSQHHNIWKPTGKVFTEVGHKWKPTGRLFTIVGNSCPLTRITPKKIVHLKETTSNSVETPKPEIKVYSRRPKQIKSVVPVAAAPRAVDIADSPVSTSIDQDAPSTGSSYSKCDRRSFLLCFTRKQLKTDAMWGYFDAFLTSTKELQAGND